jgi:hypothetical protein
MHSPEESYNEQNVDNEKADVYNIGNILYYLLTHQYIFEQYKSKQQAVMLLREGKRSPFPDHIKQSDDPAIKTIMMAIQGLWIHSPIARPRARVVADYLIKEYESITGMIRGVGDVIRLDTNITTILESL